ncbi:MAG: neuromedin U [Gammaproteobacteria bacterium]|nr:neuromedin U [Gammaproteobacteria bacterium]
MKTERIRTALLVFLIFAAAPGYAQEQSNSDLAKKAQNPIANLISLPFQNNTNFGIGPLDETQNILNIQPVWPFSMNDKWNLITRTILPVVSQPNILTGGQGRINGLGDATFTGFFSPRDSGDMTWGVGPVFLIPTATDDALGADKWGAGASVILLSMPGPWVVGSLVSNVWSFAGSGNQDVNLFTWQYFVNYNLADGWYLTSAPIITANWEAGSGNKWTVPFGGGAGKIFKIGKQPINGQASAYYNVEKPDSGADWQLRLQLQFLFPK